MGGRRIAATVAVAALGLCGCYTGEVNDSVAETNDQEAPGPSDTSSATTSGPLDCIPGQESCTCLEGNCLGTLLCVEDTCLPGPQLNVPSEPILVIAGLRVPVEAQVVADEFRWQQTGGPAADLQGVETTELWVDVPSDAAGGEAVTVTLQATRNGVSAQSDVTIEIVDPVFSEGLPGIEDAAQLGTPTAVDFRNGQLWAVSSEGFVSWFDLELDEETDDPLAVYRGRLEVPGALFGGRLDEVPASDGVDAFVVANAMNGSIDALELDSGLVDVVTDQTVDGDPLGPVRHVTRMGGELYATNGEGGQLLVWDPEPPEVDDGETPIAAGTRVLLEGLANPAAITVGPEPRTLYVGTAGQVLRVPILERGEAGPPTVYLSFGDGTDPSLVVDGLAFDRASNLFVGIPQAGRLLVARYTAGDATPVARDLDTASAAFNGFSGLAFGEGTFDRQRLYYGNGSGRVGQVFVGLGD